MPILRPESPRFQSGAERLVWQKLRDQLAPNDVLISGFRFTDREKDYEVDAILVLPGIGIVLPEVKGGSVWQVDGGWFQARGGGAVVQIHPFGGR